MDIKQESSDDHQEVSIENVAGQHENIKEAIYSTNSSIKHETVSVPICTQPQPSQHSVGRCTKVKKEEEGGEIKLEWDGDECDCEQCRVEREVKIEFNQTNANKQQQVNSSGQSQTNQSGYGCQHSLCKRVKKEEDDDAEWDEDCDCDHCRTMRLKAIPLKQTNATENRQTNSSELVNVNGDSVNVFSEGVGDETEVDEVGEGNEGAQMVGDDVELLMNCQVGDDENNKNYEGAGHDELEECLANENSQESSDDSISDESETEIDDEKYKMDVDGEESSDEETEVDEQSDREQENQFLRNAKYQARKHVCEHCHKRFTRPSLLATHIRSHTGEPFKCPWEGCNMAFAGKQSMQRHYKSHTGENLHVCEHCDKKFSYQSNLTRHIRTHTGERPFKCPWEGCKKSFAHKCNRQEHLRRHTGERPFKCPWEGCKKSFAYKCNRQEHLRRHTGQVQKNHICEHCDKKFKSPTHLKIHIRTHTGERPFECPWKNCKKMFSQKIHTQSHYKTHTGQVPKPIIKPHICEHCSKGCVSLSSITQHLRTHTGEKPYKCTWDGCDKAFALARYMKAHLCTHTGELSFKCASPNCGQGFISHYQLKKHRKVAHSEESNK